LTPGVPMKAKYTLLWAQLALQDLKEIKKYIARDNPAAAKKEAQKIKSKVLRLETFPHSGRALTTIPGVREVIADQYHVFYEVQGNKVIILRVLHGKRNIPFLD